MKKPQSLKFLKGYLKGTRLIIVLIVAVVTAWPFAYTFFAGSSHNKPSQPSTPPPKDMLSCVKSLPDSMKIGQKLMVAGYSDQLSTETSTLVSREIGGVIMMDAVTATQVSDLRKAMKIAPFIAVDQEGGPVQRYKEEGILPGAEDMASQFSTDQAYDKYLADSKY